MNGIHETMIRRALLLFLLAPAQVTAQTESALPHLRRAARR